MESTEEKLNRLFISVRQLEAENWAVKQFVTSLYAQKGDIDKTLMHFMALSQEIDTHKINGVRHSWHSVKQSLSNH